MKINSGIINKISYLYLTIPLFIFILGWLNLPTAIISTAVVIISLYFILKQKENVTIEIPAKVFWITIGICFAWVFFSGIGGTFFQNADLHLRNAVLRDLINYSYPVQYDNGVTLVYYMGIMLPGALFGKFVSLLGANQDLAYKLAGYFCTIWYTLGIVVISLQLFLMLKAKGKQFYWILLILVFFSGMDILNTRIITSHIEWHSWPWQYSSNTTLLFWVYNQTICTWLITLLILKKPLNIRNFAFLGTLCLFYGPLPFIGLFIYLAGLALTKFILCIKHSRLKFFFRNLFSIQNILSITLILPLIYFYYKSNNTVSDTEYRFFKFSHYLFKFFLIEAGAYLFIIMKNNLKNPVFYITLISLFAFPFVAIAGQQDLCMRGSIPALFVLMVLVIQFLFNKDAYKLCKNTLIAFLIIGSVTPIFEFYRGFYFTFHMEEEEYLKDNIQTLNNKIEPPCTFKRTPGISKMVNYTNYCNYGARKPEKTVFFGHLAKKIK